MQHKLIACIGGGNMAQGILFGLIQQGYPAQQIIVCDPNPEKLALFDAQGAQTSNDNVQAAQQADVLLLAVKPQIMAEVCRSLSAVDFSNKLVISIAAGISTRRLHQLLPSAQSIIRVMPNTPALVGAGISGLFAPPSVSEQDRAFAQDLLAAVGKTCWLDDEQQMHAVTAASGSSPAYFFLFMQAMQQTLEQMNIAPQSARELVQQAMLGAAKLSEKQPHLSFAELRQNVTSKGGTTAAAIEVFEQQQLAQIVQQAMQACVARSVEMEEML